jgi:hypothetical protein|tara:strand:- start:121 stop:837 length:717 start_codon:yes stop_codon:yes gene_type:complete
MNREKPLGRKAYGSIPHLPNSRIGPGDHKCHEGQERIATIKSRNKHDVIIVQEKLDGSNVAVALKDGIILPLSRAGYLANTSPYRQHLMFWNWVYENEERFRNVLNEGEQISGEWLAQAHGTRYELKHEPFVVFDIFDENRKRYAWNIVLEKLSTNFVIPHCIQYNRGNPMSVDDAMLLLGKYGYHGALDEIEGAVWRIENKGKFDFMVKYVRPNKVDGIYLEIMGDEIYWNWKEKVV